MALPRRVKDINAIPEALRTQYKQDGEEWALDIEGDAAEILDLRKKVADFRDNNLSVIKQRDQLQAALKKFEGVDPDKWAEAKEALDTLNQLEEKDLIKGGKLDEVIERRVASARKKFDDDQRALQKRNETLEKENQKYQSGYKRLRVEQAVRATIPKVGAVRPQADADLMRRAFDVFDVNEKDELVSKDVYNAEGKPILIEEWGAMLLKEAPHLFENGGGGGAGGGGKGNRQTSTTQQGDKIIHNGNAPLRLSSDQINAVAAGKTKVVNTNAPADE